jgi:hypothetical protein
MLRGITDPTGYLMPAATYFACTGTVLPGQAWPRQAHSGAR